MEFLDQWWISLKRQGVSTRFSLSVLDFPRFQESSILFTRFRESLSISFLAFILTADSGSPQVIG
jgi:hypothetical protein